MTKPLLKKSEVERYTMQPGRRPRIFTRVWRKKMKMVVADTLAAKLTFAVVGQAPGKTPTLNTGIHFSRDHRKHPHGMEILGTWHPQAMYFAYKKKMRG